MPEDRSLDEFVGRGSTENGEATSETDDSPGNEEVVDNDDESTGTDDGSAGIDNEPLVADADPAESTAAWSPGDEPCEACGEPVERRWRDGDAFVCRDCKDW